MVAGATDVGNRATQVPLAYIKINIVIIVRRWAISVQCVVSRIVRQLRRIVRQLPHIRRRSLVDSKKTLGEAPINSDSYSDKEPFNTSHNHVHHNGCRGCMKKQATTLILNSAEIQMETDTGAEMLKYPFQCTRRS